jgi:glycosyltransferase involved in cell wall biosynthesis
MVTDIYNYVDNFKKIKNTPSELIFSHKDYVQAPLVSIIITVYRREKCLYEAINSALRQNNIHFEYEVIVLNDDPKGGFEHLDDYQNINNISFYRNTVNLGLFKNLNMGALLARGKYIAYLHDDDLLYPDFLSSIYDFLKKKPEAKCILVNRDVINSVNIKTKPSSPYVFFRMLLSPVDILLKKERKPFKKIALRNGLTYLLSNIYKAPSCGTLFELKSFFDMGGYDDTYYPVSDYFFFLKFNKSHDIYMLREKLASYRWIDNLSQKKDVQLLGLRLLNSFFMSKQPVFGVNIYYMLFHNEIFQAKYVMIDERYRDDIRDEFAEIKNLNKYKWMVFKVYNKIYKHIHGFV